MKYNIKNNFIINIFLFLFIILLYFIYIIFSLIFLPFFLIIDLILNAKRKDLLFFLFSRYIFPLTILFKKTINSFPKNFTKNYPNNKSKDLSNIFIFSTSAGELKTISEIIEKTKTFEKYNIIFFYTSITAKEFSNNINFPNINFYLFPDNPIFNFIYFIKFKPIKVIFFESEIWPGVLIFSKLFKAKSYFIQGKFPQNTFTFSIYCFFVLNLFDIIIPQDNEENLKILNIKNYIPTFFKLELPINFKLLIDYQRYLNKDNSVKNNIDKNIVNEKENIIKEFFLNEILFITFASTHKNDEPFFFNLVKFLNENFEFSNIIYLLVPRHPERTDNIINEFNNKVKNKNFLNYNISPIKLSNLEYFSEFIQNIHTQNIEIICKAKSELENILKASEINPIIICDKFNILKNIYSLSKITFMGATFFWHGGGHNILEPLFEGNILICGPYLTNLKDIFEKISEHTGICAILKPENLSKFIKKKYLKKRIIYSKNTFILRNYHDLINFIKSNLIKDKNKIKYSIFNIIKETEEENKIILNNLQNLIF